MGHSDRILSMRLPLERRQHLTVFSVSTLNLLADAEDKHSFCLDMRRLLNNTTANAKVLMEVASSRPDHLLALSAAKASELSLLVKSHFWWLCRRCRQCYSDFLLQCAGDVEAYHADSGIIMDCANQNRKTPHLGD